MKITPLDFWAAKKMSLEDSAGALSDMDIASHHLARLRETISYAKDHSPYYRKNLVSFSSDGLSKLSDFSRIPFTTRKDLEIHGPEFLCVSQSLVERIFTINVPFPARKNLRVYFSAQDIEQTMDFFHHGMTTFTEPGHKVMILMPGDRPDSVGDLLARSLKRIPAEFYSYGLVHDPEDAIEHIIRLKIDTLVGIPTNVLSLLRHEQASLIAHSSIKSVLLTSDYISPSIVKELESAWGCKVFCHYGSTEMGFEGGVECENQYGYHLTEPDLYFEIVDPESGENKKSGEIGEVVFTSLNRLAMPLIRYRTGDLSRFIPGDCPCGSKLKRLDKIRGRIGDTVRLAENHWLGIPDLDDSIFSVPHVLDYQAFLTWGDESAQLVVILELATGSRPEAVETVRRKLCENAVVDAAITDGVLTIGSVKAGKVSKPDSTAVKRAMLDKRIAPQ